MPKKAVLERVVAAMTKISRYPQPVDPQSPTKPYQQRQQTTKHPTIGPTKRKMLKHKLRQPFNQLDFYRNLLTQL